VKEMKLKEAAQKDVEKAQASADDLRSEVKSGGYFQNCRKTRT